MQPRIGCYVFVPRTTIQGRPTEERRKSEAEEGQAPIASSSGVPLCHVMSRVKTNIVINPYRTSSQKDAVLAHTRTLHPLMLTMIIESYGGNPEGFVMDLFAGSFETCRGAIINACIFCKVCRPLDLCAMNTSPRPARLHGALCSTYSSTRRPAGLLSMHYKMRQQPGGPPGYQRSCAAHSIPCALVL